MSSIANFSDSDDERYKTSLARKRAEAEALLRKQEQKERLEQQAQKKAKLAERKRLEEEFQRKQEEEKVRQREEQHQRDLAHCLEADHVAAVEQQRRKNWMKTFQPLSSPSDEEINLLDYPPLTKRQRVRYLSQETLEAHQKREELSREMGTSVVGGGNPYERCVDFRILCIPQTLLHTTSCAPCAKAKAACKPFDANKACVKTKAETARRSKVRRAKQQMDVECKAEVLRKLDGLGELQGLRKDVWRIAVALEKLAGIKGQDSDKELLSRLESEEEITEVQRDKKERKQREERLGREDEEKEMGRQEEDNEMEGIEEGDSSFSPVAYSVGTGAC